MATFQNAFQINGVVDTNKSVLSNLNVLCKAAGCWLSYDVTTGLWSVIINRAGSSIKSFDKSNIIGAINITGSGVDQLYNSVEVQFPSKDTLNTIDYANFTLDNSQRYPNELDKKLNIQLDLINNPVQAQYIGAVELGQNRSDKIIQFKTDFSSIGLKAGDLIDVTWEPYYGSSRKMFRIIKIAEEDPEDGSIQLSITALEYNADIYDAKNLIYTERTTATGIVPKSMNSAITGLDLASQTNLVYSFETGTISCTGVASTTSDYDFFLANPDAMQFYNLGFSYTAKYTGRYRLDYNNNWGSQFNVSGGVIGVPQGIRKNQYMTVYKNGTRVDIDGSSIIKQADVNADIVTSGNITLTKGDVIQFWIGISSDLTNSSPGAIAGPNTTRSTAKVTGALYYLGK